MDTYDEIDYDGYLLTAEFDDDFDMTIFRLYDMSNNEELSCRNIDGAFEAGEELDTYGFVKHEPLAENEAYVTVVFVNDNFEIDTIEETVELEVE